MEIKVGMTHVNREVTIDVERTAEEIASSLAQALSEDGVLTLADGKGRRILIPAAGIAYLDLGQENARPVGFGTV